MNNRLKATNRTSQSRGRPGGISRRAVFLFSVFTAAIFLLVACGSPSVGTDPSTDADAKSPPQNVSTKLEHDFTITTVYRGQDVLGGESVKLSEVLAQGKPIVLNMWAGLCPPCRAEMPDLQAVFDEHQGQFILLGVDVGVFTGLGTQADALSLLEELNINYPSGTIDDANVLRDYRVIGMPSTYFIKPNGEIHSTWTGLLTHDQLSSMVQDLLAASGG